MKRGRSISLGKSSNHLIILPILNAILFKDYFGPSNISSCLFKHLFLFRNWLGYSVLVKIHKSA